MKKSTIALIILVALTLLVSLRTSSRVREVEGRLTTARRDINVVKANFDSVCRDLKANEGKLAILSDKYGAVNARVSNIEQLLAERVIMWDEIEMRPRSVYGVEGESHE